MDSRLQAMLDGSGLKYRVEGDLVRLMFDTVDGRDQLVIIQANPDQMGPYEDFDVLSAVMDASQLTPAVAMHLLKYAAQRKLGAIAVIGNRVYLKHDLYAGATPEALMAVVYSIAKDADELEKALTNGADQF